MSPDFNDTPPAQQIAARLRERIAADGPLPLPAYMMIALFDPIAGFYATRDPIGAGADFITAPEVSQMFGEVIGLFAIQSWQDLGAPDTLQLIELGPGKGTLMSDILRAGRVVPGFLEAVRLTLIEASPALQMVQGRTLQACPVPLGWVQSLDKAPKGPSLILGNEFLDCLPLRQAVRHDGMWRERCVGIDPDDPDRFAFVAAAALAQADEAFIPARLRDAPDGTLVELRPSDVQLVESLAARFASAPGRALFVDYGSAIPEAGDTLQAIRQHQKVDPLDQPGTADLTAHVDFAGLADAAIAAGLEVHGPALQGDFLRALGIEQRAMLLAERNPASRTQLVRQLHRLTDTDQMGKLFKVICIASPGLPAPPGLTPWAAETQG